MPRECAFCPSTAKISGEHIWSDWMNALFPIAKVTFQKVEQDGSVSKKWNSSELDMKAKVVCKRCNETWMSEIEDKHAKPAMSDLIVGRSVTEITPARAHSIAQFAFKTAVVSDQMLPKSEWFFEISDRYAFRESHSIPQLASMWLFGMENRNAGSLRSMSIYFPDKDNSHLTLNVCTFFVGQFGFQVVAAKAIAEGQVESLPLPHADLTVGFYPTLKSGVSWPRNVVLGADAFDAFAQRWSRVKFH